MRKKGLNHSFKLKSKVMESILSESDRKISGVSMEFVRYMIDEINWNSQLVAVKGARGVGKTTLLLQYMSKQKMKSPQALYISMEHQYFYDNRLIEMADEFYKNGGKYLFLDEVHKYPNWSREIKLIYDNYPEIKLVFTSSSILNINMGEADLSRRAISYTMTNLSLREFIDLDSGIKLNRYSLNDILTNHQEIALDINKKIKPIKEFSDYVKYGAYPYFKEDKSEYHAKLLSISSLIMEVDINTFYNPDYILIYKLKRLLFAIAESSPFTPNVAKLSERIGVSRPTLLKTFKYLQEALLIIAANKPNNGIGALSKPDKLYLHNSNLIYAYGKEHANVGNIRETFFINQLMKEHKVNVSTKADFLIDNKYTFEIGGKSKGKKQIADIKNSFIIKDDIESGVLNIIPLWLFGFMY